jgi:predicted AAA+ superfamily ATPase
MGHSGYMPHQRARYLGKQIKRSLGHSAITGILGQRQTGKTTLLESYGDGYVTFDKEAALMQAEANPEAFLLHRKAPFAIDEAQLCERMFPALKEHVRTHKKPGQFLLSGSVRFTSRKLIRESLTGRIVALELLPFSIAESESEPCTDHIRKVLALGAERRLIDYFTKSAKRTPRQFKSFLECGGLPGICFFRDFVVRDDKFQAHIHTLLNRDLRLIYETSLPYSSLRALLVFLARQQGKPFDWKLAAEESQISTITLKRVMFAFEALFLTREVRSIGEERKSVYFLEDQGMASWLTDRVLDEPQDIVRGIFSNLRQEFHYRPEVRGEIFQYRTKHGVNVPLVFRSRLGTLGIVATMEHIPAPKTLGSAQSFLDRIKDSKVVVAYGGSEVQMRSENHIWVPYWMLT